MAGPDYIVDIQGVPTRTPHGSEGNEPSTAAPPRPWLAVLWRCCSVYSRVYRNRDGSAYDGACPRCGKPLRVPIGPGGTNHRFFEAH